MKMLAIAAGMLFATNVHAAEDQDTTVVVPETGYLAIKASKPFIGPANMLIVNTNASNNASTTDLRYYTWRADTVVAMASCYVLVAQPGTYKLTYAAEATLKGSSNLGWFDGTGKFTETKRNRVIYKFVNTPGRVGFVRDETYASEAYKSCDFAEGEHLYISTTTAVCDKIAAANGKTSNTDLDFIEWHGPTQADAVAGISQIANGKSSDGKIFDLQGRQVVKPSKGIYVKDSKKIIVK